VRLFRSSRKFDIVKGLLALVVSSVATKTRDSLKVHIVICTFFWSIVPLAQYDVKKERTIVYSSFIFLKASTIKESNTKVCTC